MIRIAAAGDIHFSHESAGFFRPWLERLRQDADILLLAGDLTNWGEVDEAHLLAKELREIPVPVVAVLGNHDHHCEHPGELVQILTEEGHIFVLEGETVVFTIRDETLGIVGSKGFGGGFGKACITPFGETEIKQFLQATYHAAEGIERGLKSLKTDYRVVLLHYSPISDTLEGEAQGIYPFLGSSILGEPIDAYGADLVLHGHAHAGVEKGQTLHGVPVRNVAVPVIDQPYALYELFRHS